MSQLRLRHVIWSDGAVPPQSHWGGSRIDASFLSFYGTGVVRQMPHFTTQPMNACHEAMLQIVGDAGAYSGHGAEGCSREDGAGGGSKHRQRACT
jgi:hypothetical protein